MRKLHRRCSASPSPVRQCGSAQPAPTPRADRDVSYGPNNRPTWWPRAGAEIPGRLGQSVVVLNKPGGAHRRDGRGARRPDGYTPMRLHLGDRSRPQLLKNAKYSIDDFDR
jgi:hypothetical protein